MYNDFVVVGPNDDPAGIRGLNDASAAFATVARAMQPFVSRGDDSGTHKKERDIWRTAGIDVASASGTWYRETGAGMGATLNTATAMAAYALTDRATWISFRNKAGHEILVEGDVRLKNQYGVIPVSPMRHPHVQADLSAAFVDWLTGPAGQRAIRDFRVAGQQLFFPNAQ